MLFYIFFTKYVSVESKYSFRVWYMNLVSDVDYIYIRMTVPGLSGTKQYSPARRLAVTPISQNRENSRIRGRCVRELRWGAKKVSWQARAHRHPYNVLVVE